MNTTRKNGLKIIRNLNNSKKNAEKKLKEINSRLSWLDNYAKTARGISPDEKLKTSEDIIRLSEMRNFFIDHVDWVSSMSFEIGSIIEHKERQAFNRIKSINKKTWRLLYIFNGISNKIYKGVGN